MPSSDVSADTFIKVWNASESREQVSKVTGLSYNTVCSRQKRYTEEMGIPLKKMPRAKSSKLDLEALRALAASTNPDTQAEVETPADGEAASE